MPRRVVIVCNALDDETRAERGISTDSPAATRKVFLLCRALRTSGVRALVLSLGRGRADGSPRYHPARVRRVQGVPVVYVPFSHRRVLSGLLSLVGPVPVVRRIGRYAGSTTFVFYNRTPAFVPALLAASASGCRTVLDLEDGEVGDESGSLRSAFYRGARWLYERVCSGGALLACSALAEMTDLRPVRCYYGAVEGPGGEPEWTAPDLVVQLGGTVSRDTGAMLLADAIRILRRDMPGWGRRLRFEITGQGDCVPVFEELAREGGAPTVTVRGRTSEAEYRRLLRSAHVGLALKPASGNLATTTFPSKVVELANEGLLVVTTDISDVRRVLGTGAIYLTKETPEFLLDRLQWVAEKPEEAAKVARGGALAVSSQCSLASVSQGLANFLFSASA